MTRRSANIGRSSVRFWFGRSLDCFEALDIKAPRDYWSVFCLVCLPRKAETAAYLTTVLRLAIERQIAFYNDINVK